MKRYFLLFLVPVLALFFCTSSATALTYTVNSTEDSQDFNLSDNKCWTGNYLGSQEECTLRAAIMEANAHVIWPGADPHQINLIAGTFILSVSGVDDVGAVGDLDLTQPVIIQGAANHQSIIDGGGIDLIFDVRLSSAYEARLENLVLQNGKGGAVFLTSGKLTLLNDIIQNNTAGLSGGGIKSLASTQLYLYKSRISGNSANLGGGGLRVEGYTRIDETTIGPNNTTVAGTGGIELVPGSTAYITNSTIYKNSGQIGGLSNSGSVSMVNSTISGNTGSLAGGISSSANSAIYLFDTTIAYNQGEAAPGIKTFAPVSLGLQNTLLANNTITPSGVLQNCDLSAGTNMVIQGVNLDSGNSCELTDAGQLHNSDARLGPLQDNGGPTLTHALLQGSRAIDSGSTICQSIDQRGVTRPQQKSCDIGAFEQDYFFPWILVYPAIFHD